MTNDFTCCVFIPVCVCVCLFVCLILQVPTGKKSSSQDSSGSSDNQESLKLEDLFDLIHDCELLKKQVCG